MYFSVLILIDLAYAWVSQLSEILSPTPQLCLSSFPERFAVGLNRQIPVWLLYSLSVMSA